LPTDIKETGYVQKEGTAILFVGTYTEKESWIQGKAEGIYEYEMDQKSGTLHFLCKSQKTVNPSYLAVHPNKQCLYAVNETEDSSQNLMGTVSVFDIDIAHRSLDFTGKVSSQGKSPCNVSVDKYGKFVMVANYGSGTIALFPVARLGLLQEAVSIDRHVGKGPTSRQEGPHAHMIIPSPYMDFVYSIDLGTDQIIAYKLDREKQQLVPTGSITKTAPGAGPRQMTFSRGKPWAYVVNELNGTIEAFKVDSITGALVHFQTISTFTGAKGDTAAAADIHITPSGKYLYATNRGNMNNIAMYALNSETGELSLIGYQSSLGKTPRNFVIDPTGTFLLVANQDSDNVVTFRIDPKTGRLIETGIEAKIPTPVCLKFL
jgi:6-phosphogluconolactonase